MTIWFIVSGLLLNVSRVCSQCFLGMGEEKKVCPSNFSFLHISLRVCVSACLLVYMHQRPYPMPSMHTFQSTYFIVLTTITLSILVLFLLIYYLALYKKGEGLFKKSLEVADKSSSKRSRVLYSWALALFRYSRSCESMCTSKEVLSFLSFFPLPPLFLFVRKGLIFFEL
jgi:hypothetical protein